MNQPDIFDLFKRNKSIQTAAKKAAEVVLFQLKFDDKGAYISIIDKKGKVIRVLNESEDAWKDLEKPIIEISTLKANDGTDLYYRMIILFIVTGQHIWDYIWY